jgi:hypothetical protein
VPVVFTEQPYVPGVATADIWKYEIVDEGQLPRGYLKPDEQKIGAAVRAGKGTITIPGVRIWKEKNIRA